MGDPERHWTGGAAGGDPVAAPGRTVGSDHPSGTAPAAKVLDAASPTPATGTPALMLPSLATASPSTAMPPAAGTAPPAVGIVPAMGRVATAGAEAVEAAALSTGASVLAAPAAAAVVLLALTSTAANDTLLAKGIPIGPPLREPRVDVGDLGGDLNLGANAFTPAPSPASGSPPLVPSESGPMQESLPIATANGWRESLTPPAPLPPLPGFGTPDMSDPTASEGFAPSGGDVPIIFEARKPLGPDVLRVNGRYPRNASYAGQNYPASKLPSALQALYPDGVDFTPQGFPDFKPYVKAETKLSNLTGNRKKRRYEGERSCRIQEHP